MDGLVSSIDVVDVHVGGDVHRIVLGGIEPPPGRSVLDRMTFLRDRADGLRRFLLNEPRGGHPSLFANLIVPPSHPDANAGYVIMETMGYPMFSGTNTISTAHAVLESGLVEFSDGENTVILESPGGLVEIRARCGDGQVGEITYVADMPAYVAETGLSEDVPGYGRVPFDVVWTGVFYPIVDMRDAGLSLSREKEREILDFSRCFVETVSRNFRWVHPTFGDPGPPAFVVVTGPADVASDGTSAVRRVSTYVHPSAGICRSPAGTGTMAVATLLDARGDLAPGQCLRAISPFDTWLDGRIVDRGEAGAKIAITGKAWTIARSTLPLDPSDPMTPDEGLRRLLAPAPTHKA